MHAIILSIGDELVLGQTIDTNSAWLSQQLASIGISVLAHTTVGDDQSAIERAIKNAAPQCDTLIISGGIGPTPDDLTRQALAAILNQPLELNERWLSFLKDFFAKRSRTMPEMNRIQAMIPRGSKIILNTCGTASGIHAQLTTDNGQRTTHIYVIPGVPMEMKSMFTRDILPELKKQSSGGVILSKTLHTFGLGESTIAEMLGPLMHRSRNPTVGTTVSSGIVSVRINSKFNSHDEAQHQLTDTEQSCREALGDIIFGADDQTLPQVVAALLKQNDKTITTAESCTGGLLAKFLTDIPGSSAFFNQGWITYSNYAKQKLLGVNIGPEGAVSEKTVAAMSIEALFRATADYALAISGIAGPDGGTPEKPVGTVCIGLAHWDGDESRDLEDQTEVTVRKFLFAGDREMIRDRAAKMALTMLRFALLDKILPF
jgi:nicotinamide-nucleotide amidase